MRGAGDSLTGLRSFIFDLLRRLGRSLAGPLIAGCLGLFAAGPAIAADEPVFLPSEPLVIIGADGTVHRVEVEVARTEAQRNVGLMFRHELAPDHGMLFLFDPPQPVVMWMKNTYVPLDMLFVDGTGRVTSIARDTVPLSETLVRSGGPVRAVLELVGGLTARLGIGLGARLDHPAFAEPGSK